MPIGPGSRVGPYEVAALIGEGGMGKVWRAHHAALKRDDALKVLPDAFVADPERLARFHREAQVLASLNHPNIAHVYGLEEADGVRALIMELVEGPTLADRIAEGAIPLREALSIATQVAEGLAAAHEQGIVHRDLKPANIKIGPDGTVKVLDFGLAKAMDGPPDSRSVGLQPDLSLSPTITTPAMTQVGVILGTAAYMSPEQAKGRPADKRSDIWAFGCVLYEMLTGRRAFDGEDVGDTLASVIKGDPEWSPLPSDLPPAVRTLLERCLTKDRRKRIGDIAAAQFVLTEQATPEWAGRIGHQHDTASDVETTRAHRRSRRAHSGDRRLARLARLARRASSRCAVLNLDTGRKCAYERPADCDFPRRFADRLCRQPATLCTLAGGDGSQALGGDLHRWGHCALPGLLT